MAKHNPNPSKKRILINKNNATVIIMIASMAFVTVFSLIASKALLSQRSYQANVIAEKKKALAQLKSNNDAAGKLVDSYKVFVSPSENIIGGSKVGKGDRDGDNAKIILDALPSKYDFPALATSIEKILTGLNFKIEGINGTDDEIKQSVASTGAVQPVEMPFELSVVGNYETAQALSEVFQRSIRPIKVSLISLDGEDGNLNVVVGAKTYYQPEKVISITTKVVK